MPLTNQPAGSAKRAPIPDCKMEALAGAHEAFTQPRAADRLLRTLETGGSSG